MMEARPGNGREGRDRAERRAPGAVRLSVRFLLWFALWFLPLVLAVGGAGLRARQPAAGRSHTSARSCLGRQQRQAQQPQPGSVALATAMAARLALTHTVRGARGSG